MFNRSRITDLNPESYGRKKLVEEVFREIETTAWKDISPEEAEAFMAVYHKIYKNLSETGCEHTGKEESNK